MNDWFPRATDGFQTRNNKIWIAIHDSNNVWLRVNRSPFAAKNLTISFDDII